MSIDNIPLPTVTRSQPDEEDWFNGARETWMLWGCRLLMLDGEDSDCKRRPQEEGAMSLKVFGQLGPSSNAHGSVSAFIASV